jgi:2-iminobutanoate/2-iminopropanoate deaminase
MITDLFSERIKVMKYISTDKAPAAIGPYSQAIVTGNLLFASGQIALDPATGAVKGETIAEQTTTVCENIGEILKAAGTTYDKVVKTTCFLADIADFAAFNEVYAKYFTGKPARSCVAVKDLPKKVLCEIEIIAEIL